MKRYKVYVYNTVDKFWDCYEVNAIDPVDARNVAVQRLVDETGHGLDVYEIKSTQTTVGSIAADAEFIQMAVYGRSKPRGSVS